MAERNDEPKEQRDLFDRHAHKRGWSLRQRHLQAIAHLLLPIKVVVVDGKHRDGSPRLVGVSRSTMLGVLKAIDDSCGDKSEFTLKKATLMQKTGLSRITVIRAVKALKKLDLLIVQRKRGRNCNTYHPVWPNIEEFVFWPNVLDRLDPETTPHETSHHETSHDERETSHGERETSHGERETSHGETPYLPSSLPSRSPSSSVDPWTATAALLIDLEVRKVKQALDAARGNGCGGAEVLALLEHAWAMRPAWTGAEIYHRVCDHVPGRAIESGWPPPSADYQQQQAQAAAETERACERKSAAAWRAQSQTDETNYARLDELFGPGLDRLDRAELDALIRRTLQRTGSFSDFMLKSFRRNASNSSGVRNELLNQLALESQPAAEKRDVPSK